MCEYWKFPQASMDRARMQVASALRNPLEPDFGSPLLYSSTWGLEQEHTGARAFQKNTRCNHHWPGCTGLWL